MTSSRDSLRRHNWTRRVIYLLVALAVLVPYILPYFISVPLPFKPSPWAKKLYDRIDSLKSGSHVLLSFDYDPAAQAELTPMARALLLHCFKKGLVPIVMTHWSSGVGMTEQICREAAADAQKQLDRPIQSGRDYVFLGFKPTGSNLLLNMGDNLKSAFDKDYYGKPTAGMPALEGINSLKDISLAVDLAAGATVGMWIAYGSDRFGFPLGVGTTAVQAPDLYPFLNSNQIIGFLGGLRGAADYEKLLNAPGDATRGMLAQSATHVLLILLIVGANLWLLVGRLARKRKD